MRRPRGGHPTVIGRRCLGPGPLKSLAAGLANARWMMDEWETYERQFDAADMLLQAATDGRECRACCAALFGFWERWLAAARNSPDRQSTELRVFVSAAILIRESSSPWWGYVWAWLRRVALGADDDRLIAMDVGVFEVIRDSIDFDSADEFQNLHQLVGLLAATSGLSTHQRWRADHIEAIRPLASEYMARLADAMT